MSSRFAVQSAKMSVCVQPPLAVTQDQFVLDSLGTSNTPVSPFHSCFFLHFTDMYDVWPDLVNWHTAFKMSARFKKEMTVIDSRPQSLGKKSVLTIQVKQVNTSAQRCFTLWCHDGGRHGGRDGARGWYVIHTLYKLHPSLFISAPICLAWVSGEHCISPVIDLWQIKG